MIARLRNSISWSRPIPKVSVVIASYNHERYVHRAISSVLEQTFQDFEVVVTDDGSSDRTVEEVQRISDGRVSLRVLPSNYGACVAMNESIKRAKGKYIAVLNSDDAFLPAKLEKQVRFLEANPEVAAVFAYPDFIDENGNALREEHTYYRGIFRVGNRTREQWLRRLFIQGNCFCHPSLLIRRSCYREIGLYDPTLAQLPDMEMWVRLLARYRIHILEESLLEFRISSGETNASAPRQDATVRLYWEWQQVLGKYLELDNDLIVRVFPELSSFGGQRTVRSRIARLAHRALVRYMDGKNADRGKSFIESLDNHEVRWPLSWGLAEFALKVPLPAHAAFALSTMRKALLEMEGDSRYRKYISFTGAYDPFGILSGMPGNRSLEYLRSLRRPEQPPI